MSAQALRSTRAKKTSAILVSMIVGLTAFASAPPAFAVDAPACTINPGTGAKVNAIRVVTATCDQSLEATSTLILFDGAETRVAGASAVSSNVVRFEAVEALFELGNSYTARLVATSLGGSAPTQVESIFDVDTTAPEAPLISLPAEGARLQEITVSGSSEAGSRVDISEGATLLASATAGTDGSYSASLALGSEDDVTHIITATATDEAGNLSGVSLPRTFRHDNVAPQQPVIAAPGAGARLRPPFAVRGTLRRVDGMEEGNGAIVKVFDGRTELGMAPVTAGGNWTFTVPSLTEGNHVLRATGIDGAGNGTNVDEAPTVAVVIDTRPPAQPTISVTPTPINAANVGAISIFGGTDTEAIEVDVEVRDAGGATVTCSDLSVNPLSGSYACTRSLAGLADGQLEFRATAGDAATPQNRLTSPVLALRKDTLLPAAPTCSLLDLQTGGDGIINAVEAPAVTLACSWTDGATAQISIDDTDGATPALVSTLPIAVAGSFQLPRDVRSLRDGVLTARVVIVDENGNAGTAGIATATKDATAPNAPAIATATQPNADAGSARICGTAEPGSRVAVFVDGRQRATTTANGAGNWCSTIGGLADNEYSFTAIQTDVAGNPGSALSNALGLIIDTHAPSVAALTPADGSISNVTRQLRARYDEPLSGGTVSLRNGRGTLVAGSTAVSGSDATFLYAGGHLPEAGNPYTATTSASDLVARASGDRSWTFTVDIEPFIAITTPSHSVALPGAAVVSGTALHDLALRNPTVRLVPESGVGPSYGPYTATCTGCAGGNAKWNFGFPVDILPNRYLAIAAVCDVENHCSDQRSITIYVL